MTRTIVEVVASLAIAGGSGVIGAWLAMRMVRKRGQVRQGESAIGYIRARLRRSRKLQRELLTPGERFIAWAMTLMSAALAPAGVLVVLLGDHSIRFVGIAMLMLALIVTAVPVSPILQARVRRRQRTDGQSP